MPRLTLIQHQPQPNPKPGVPIRGPGRIIANIGRIIASLVCWKLELIFRTVHINIVFYISKSETAIAFCEVHIISHRSVWRELVTVKMRSPQFKCVAQVMSVLTYSTIKLHFQLETI